MSGPVTQNTLARHPPAKFFLQSLANLWPRRAARERWKAGGEQGLPGYPSMLGLSVSCSPVLGNFSFELLACYARE
jgi:hypothetical protein